jgi:Amt family ammonium transporter
VFPQSALIAFLLPLGLWLTLVSSAHRTLEARAAAAGLIALTVSALVYLAAGFGIMFGGVGVLGGQRQFAELGAFFGLPVEGGTWAITGLKGFFLEGVSSGRALFVAWLPLAQACAVLVAVPLWRRYPPLAIVVSAALATLAFSVVGMAVWGGGSGAALATQLRLGHGPVDFGGLSIAGTIGGMFSLLATRRRAGAVPTLPESPHPLRLALGFGLACIGAASALASNPLIALAQAATADYAIVIISATAAAGLSSLGYALFVSKRPSIETVTASMLAALIAVSAGAMALPVWAAIMLGLASALSVIAGGYVWNRRVDTDRASLGVPYMLIPAAFGLLTAGIAATGVYGAGLNGIGAESYLGTRGLGVAGLIGGPGGIADPGQVTAQLAILILCAGVAAAFGLPLRVFANTHVAIETEPEAVAPEASREILLDAGAQGASRDVNSKLQPLDIEPAIAASAPTLVPVVAATPEPVQAPAVPILQTPALEAPPKSTASAEPPTSTPVRAPTREPAARGPNLLDRLRGNRPVEKPKPVGQARRVAYPVRVGGRRLILRAMPPENKPAEAAKDADQP